MKEQQYTGPVQGQGRHAKPSMMKRIRKRFSIFSVRAGMDMPFFFLVMVLLVIGLVMMFSASYANSYYHNDGNSYTFIAKQAPIALLGVVAMILVSYFDYHHLHKFAVPVLVLSMALLALVLVAPQSISPTIKGARRWLYFGSFNFQPSEIAKVALVLVFAHLISINFDKMRTFRYGILPYVIILGALAGLVMMENHMSATLILVLLAAVMLFIGGVRLWWFGLAFAGFGGAAAYFLFFTDKFAYAMERVQAWIDPFNPPPDVNVWQIQQSLMAIGSGGLLGLGLGQSRQKYLYLPEPQNDFVFAIVCEELGFIGALIIIVLFAMLVWRGITVSLRARDKFGMLLGIGLTVQVGLQVLLNIGVVTSTIPNTGISLPFFSYGGTSLFLLLAEMGIVLSISRNSAIEKA